MRSTGTLKGTNVRTLPYPGFPTDLQPLMVSLLACADGTSTMTENVWENRYQYVDELRRMGANIMINGRLAVIQGVKNLVGCPVRATDLRAGAAMVVAGLAARSETSVYSIHYIDRGYEYFAQKLIGLGADITRVNED